MSQKEGKPLKSDFVPQRLDFNQAEVNPRPSKAEAIPNPQKKDKAPAGPKIPSETNAPLGVNAPNVTSRNAKAQTASKPSQGRTPSVKSSLAPESQL